MSLTVSVSAMFMTWTMLAYPTGIPTVGDTLPSVGPIAAPMGLTYVRVGDSLASDTTQQQRQKAITYSDGYYTRLTWHRRLSWAMLPLFAASYASGDQILSKGADAPAWARNLHGPAATGSAVLFGANTVTGAWNLWEGRVEPAGRARRITHAVLFTAASSGFVYAGTTLADDAQQSQAKRQQHRNVALASMGVSTASWLLMVFGND